MLVRVAARNPYLMLGALVGMHVASIAAANHYATQGRATEQRWAWTALGLIVLLIDVPVLLLWIAA